VVSLARPNRHNFHIRFGINMSKTVNRFSDQRGLYVKSRSNGYPYEIEASYSTAAGWDVDSASLVDEPTIEIVSEPYSVLSRYSLDINPSSGADTYVYTNSGTELLVGDNGRRFSFNAKIIVPSVCIIKTYLYLSTELHTSVTPLIKTVYPGTFTAVRSNLLTIPISSSTTYSIKARIEVSGHGGSTFHITSPNLIDDQMYFENIFVHSSRPLLPDFYWDVDSQQTDPTMPMHRLIDCMNASADDAFEEYKSLYEHQPYALNSLQEQITINNVHSTLSNPYYVNPRYAPWLAQFVGTKSRKNIYDSSNAPYLPSSESERSYEKWQLSTGFYGIAAGSRQALLESAKQCLHFTKNGLPSTYAVAITPEYLGDPFKILIQTLVNETPDCIAELDSSELVVQSVEDARPMGYKIYHEAKTEFEFTVGNPVLGIVGSSSGIPIGETNDGYDWFDVLSKSRSSDVATITTDGSHWILVGDTVEVIDVDASGGVFNGTYTVTAVTTDTFSYSNPGTDVSTTSDTGQVRR